MRCGKKIPATRTGDEVFHECPGLGPIIIPESVESIANIALKDWPDFTEVPNNKKSMHFIDFIVGLFKK